MKRVLAIRTVDRDFGEQLAKKFNGNQDFYFETYVFSEADAFISFAKTNIINVLLCDEELMDSDSEPRNAELVIHFSEISIAGEMTASRSIFKYQAPEGIMREILSLYKEFGTIRVSENSPKMLTKRVCCVCSPVGGAYGSTFALALAYKYAQSDRSLFISFDPFFMLPGTSKDPKEKNISDLSSYIGTMLDPKTEGDGRIIELTREYMDLCTIKMGNLELLNGCAHWVDICDLDVKRMHFFLESICNTGYYRYVVFDAGVFGASCMQILLVADSILVPYKDTPLGRKNLKEWERQIDFSGNRALLDKTKELIIPFDEGLKGEYGYEDLLKGTLGRFISENDF